jgi:hypothetical protein
MKMYILVYMDCMKGGIAYDNHFQLCLLYNGS